ncbi:MAG: glycosyl hydrolase [Microgenomates group bacterium]
MNNSFKFKNILFLLIIVVSVPVSLILLNQKTNFFNRASGTNANLIVDATDFKGGKNESWRYLAQGGEEKGRQLLPVLDQVRNLKPKYIRIDHVFDYYTADELDQVVKDIVTTGAKPFIALSYMPVNLSKDGDVTSLPNDWQAWENLVQSTVERISGRSGLNIDGVYYEVWNEPDLFGKFKYSGNKNYIELYSHTVTGANRANNVNSFKIGGPATTGFYDNWLNAMIAFSQQNGVRLDFLSWHKYSKNLADFEEDLDKASHFEGYETIITELGPNSENDKVYDEYFGGIHLIATTALMEGKIDKIFNFEIKDGVGKEKYWGRWGMLTHEKWGTPEIKPRYQAFQFLNNMIGSTPINVTGQGSWVKSFAKRNDQKIQILIVNYDHYGTHSEAVPLKVVNLPSNTFNLKRIDFNGSISTERIELPTNTWETTLFFKSNTASILELSN